FYHYLQIERGLAENTIISYRRDLNQYIQFAKEKKQMTDWKQMKRTDIVQFLYSLKEDGKSTATIARMISAIRAFHQFLIRDRIVDTDASLHIETPKLDRLFPQILTSREIDKLLAINGTTPLAIRNKAMLELLYATG